MRGREAKDQRSRNKRCRYGGLLPLGAALSVACLLAGCVSSRSRVEPVRIANRHLGPLTVAVAPALNLSGSRDFDPNRFADIMASELSYAEATTVIPVSRVLGVLAVQGAERIESPEHALEVARLVGADALLVFAVTDYDPYDPPRIGISAQLYGTRPGAGGGGVDPVHLSRQARLASSAEEAPAPRGLLAQTQRTFDASHHFVAERVRRFAQWRGTGDSPYGWRKYLVSQQEYFRFCSYVTLQALLAGEEEPVGAGGAAAEEGTP